MIKLTRREEIVLSYFCGLAPIGQPFLCGRQQGSQDLGWKNPTNFNHVVRLLIHKGLVSREQIGVYRVLKRLEEVQYEIWQQKTASKPDRVPASMKQPIVRDDLGRVTPQHPCSFCELPDCDERHHQCELKVILRAFHKLKRAKKQAGELLTKLSSIATYELYGRKCQDIKRAVSKKKTLAT